MSRSQEESKWCTNRNCQRRNQDRKYDNYCGECGWRLVGKDDYQNVIGRDRSEEHVASTVERYTHSENRFLGEVQDRAYPLSTTSYYPHGGLGRSSYSYRDGSERGQSRVPSHHEQNSRSISIDHHEELAMGSRREPNHHTDDERPPARIRGNDTDSHDDYYVDERYERPFPRHSSRESWAKDEPSRYAESCFTSGDAMGDYPQDRPHAPDHYYQEDRSFRGGGSHWSASDSLPLKYSDMTRTSPSDYNDYRRDMQRNRGVDDSPKSRYPSATHTLAETLQSGGYHSEERDYEERTQDPDYGRSVTVDIQTAPDVHSHPHQTDHAVKQDRTDTTMTEDDRDYRSKRKLNSTSSGNSSQLRTFMRKKKQKTTRSNASMESALRADDESSEGLGHETETSASIPSQNNISTATGVNLIEVGRRKDGSLISLQPSTNTFESLAAQSKALHFRPWKDFIEDSSW